MRVRSHAWWVLLVALTVPQDAPVDDCNGCADPGGYQTCLLEGGSEDFCANLVC
jgi:hypothetical protein